MLTGDVKANHVCDVKADFDNPESVTVASELAENPHIKFINGNRGYARNTLTATDWRVDFRVVDVVTTPGAPVRTRVTFVIEDGQPGAMPV